MDLSKLRKRREKLDLTQWELAKKVGVTPQTIRSWENGVIKPKKENQETLEAVLEDVE